MPPVTSAPQVSFDRIRVEAAVCRRSFREFVLRFWETLPGAGRLDWNWHIDVFCTELQETFRNIKDETPKPYDLVFNVPFGTSKSSVLSILSNAWVWTWFPECRFLCATHTDSLVLDLADRTRQVIRSEKYRRMFPNVELRDDRSSREDFQNTAGGERKSCTVGGVTPTGRHSHAVLIDDPLDPQGARSQAELDKASKFMSEVIPSRVVNKAVCPTILVMQRVHQHDPTHVMLESAKIEGATPVRHICLPAELSRESAPVKPPELERNYVDRLLDPKRMPRSVLLSFKAKMGTFAYSAQMGQSAIPRKGGMFEQEWYRQRVRSAPYDCIRIRYWDRGATEGGGCPTAGVLMARDKEGRFYVEHVEHGQWEPNKRNDKICGIAQRDRTRYGKYEPVIYVEAERGSTGLESFQNLARRLAGFPIREDQPTGSKDVRAEPWADQCAAMNVWLVEDGTWDIDGYVDEHCLFKPEPGKRLGKLKDRVDGSCLVAGTVVSTSEGRKAIEYVRPGDLVHTRFGLREVLWSGESGRVDALTAVLFSDGKFLVGTADHLVWTPERGYITMETLLGCDSVMTDTIGKNICQANLFGGNVRFVKKPTSDRKRLGVAREHVLGSTVQGKGGSILKKRLCTREKSIDEGYLTENTFPVQEVRCIGLCGQNTTAPFPLVVISITKTGIQQTMTSEIWNASLRESMLPVIQEKANFLDNWNICEASEMRPPRGIVLQKVGNGIFDTPSEHGGREHADQKGINAITVESVFQALVLGPKTVDDSVRRFARIVIENLEELRRVGKRPAPSAGKSLSAPNESDAVRENVGHGGDGKISVYDLNVKDAHEFYANGVLVHNSGAFNLLVGKPQPLAQMRALPFRKPSEREGTKPRIVVLTFDELATMVIEESSLLVMFRDPSPQREGVVCDGGSPDFGREQRTGGHAVEVNEGDRPPQSLPADTAGGMPAVIHENGRVDPPLPLHGIGKLIDSVTIQFADIDPADLQDVWEQPLEPWGVKPESIVMGREHGRKLWSFLTKKRPGRLEAIIFVDGGDRRAVSAAMAVCDVQGLRGTQDRTERLLWRASDPENRHRGDAPNRHVFETVKASRNLVM